MGGGLKVVFHSRGQAQLLLDRGICDRIDVDLVVGIELGQCLCHESMYIVLHLDLNPGLCHKHMTIMASPELEPQTL